MIDKVRLKFLKGFEINLMGFESFLVRGMIVVWVQ